MSGGFRRRWFSEPNVPLLGADVMFRTAEKNKINKLINRFLYSLQNRAFKRVIHPCVEKGKHCVV